MTPEELAQLREPFPPEEVGKLPRITCPRCRDASGKVCSDHAKSKCQVCDNYITGAHMHLDYVGHAETTDRLLSVDPEWTWEPIAWTDDGTPAIVKHGTNVVMWARLTVCGMTRLGVGTAPAAKDDAHKELIGDFLRNAAMRFGVALDLWRKSEKADAHIEAAEERDEAPCGLCGEIVPGARSDKEPMRAHRVQVHGWERREDGTVAPPEVVPATSTGLPVQEAGGGSDDAPRTEAPDPPPATIDDAVRDRLLARMDALPDAARRVVEDVLVTACDGRFPHGLTAEDVPTVSELIEDGVKSVKPGAALAARAMARANGGAT